jgi:hypothetical protein
MLNKSLSINKADRDILENYVISVPPRQNLLLALRYTLQARGLAAEAPICYILWKELLLNELL